MRSARIRAASAAALALAACTDATGPGGGFRPVEPVRALTAVEQRALVASNGFGLAMLGHLVRETPTQNVVVSPLSGAAALGMTMNGTSGETLAGMQRALGVAGMPLAESNAAYRALVPLLVNADPAVTIRSANALWPRTGFALRPEFVRTVQEDFGATVRTLDFGDQRGAAATVNGWAREQTNGLIPEVMKAEQFTDDLVLLLQNALYFKGPWTARFEVRNTAPRPFTLADGRVASVPTMSRERTALRAGSEGGVQVIELPFGGGAYAMTFVLPPRGGSLAALVASLDGARWERLMRALRADTQEVLVPKFELRGERFWNEPLRAMGMARAFDDTAAEFDRLSDGCTGPMRRCFISFVKQNAVVKVDEVGAEAAAVTTVGVGVTSAGPPPAAVDRAFVFAIRERSTGAILFVGQVTDPRER